VDGQTAETLLATAEEATAGLREAASDAAQVRLEEIYPELAGAFDFFLTSDPLVSLSAGLEPEFLARARSEGAAMSNAQGVALALDTSVPETVTH
jgi:hypothetical protein